MASGSSRLVPSAVGRRVVAAECRITAQVVAPAILSAECRAPAALLDGIAWAAPATRIRAEGEPAARPPVEPLTPPQSHASGCERFRGSPSNWKDGGAGRLVPSRHAQRHRRWRCHRARCVARMALEVVHASGPAPGGSAGGKGVVRERPGSRGRKGNSSWTHSPRERHLPNGEDLGGLGEWSYVFSVSAEWFRGKRRPARRLPRRHEGLQR